MKILLFLYNLINNNIDRLDLIKKNESEIHSFNNTRTKDTFFEENTNIRIINNSPANIVMSAKYYKY